MMRALLFTILFTFALLVSACSSASRQTNLWPVSDNGKWGFVNRAGEIAINPQFEMVTAFKEGFATVKSGGKYGFIDSSGLFVINPTYDSVAPFSEGLAVVNQGGACGYIDSTGKMVIELKFEMCMPFKDGLAPVKSLKEWGFIGKAGSFVISSQFEDVQSFSEGLAAAKEGNKWGFIDTSGKFVINPQFDGVDGKLFTEGAQLALWMNGMEKLEGGFSDGLAAVRIGEQWGFVGRDGRMAISPQFQDVMPFVDGLASATVSGGQCGYIDKAGVFVINPKFVVCLPFSDGVALIGEPGRFGFIDKTGAYTINPQFESFTMVPVMTNGLASFGSLVIDTTGQTIWKSATEQKKTDSDSNTKKS